MTIQTEHLPSPSALALMLLMTPGCSGYVDLDVTLFDHVDLTEQLENHTIDTLPTEGGAVEVMRRAELDLSGQLGDDLLGQVDDITIQELSYRVPENSMTTELDAITIYIGPIDALTPKDEGVVELARLNRLSPMTTIETTPLPAGSVGRAGLIYHLLQFKMTMFITATVQVRDPSQMPTGTGLIEIDVKASVHKYN